MNDTAVRDAPRIVSLRARAVIAAQRTPAPDRVDSAWVDHSNRLVANLACLLGVDPLIVTAAPDWTRRYGLAGIPATLLTVIDLHDDKADQPYRFVPELGHHRHFYLLAPCLDCRIPVSTYRITSLADLGHILTDEPTTDRRAPDHIYDPAHTDTCPQKQSLRQNGSATTLFELK